MQAKTDGMTVNGAMDARLPGNLNVSFAGVDGEALLVSLDDIAVSSGAACTQAEPSHVLMALGLIEGARAGVAAIRHRPDDDGGRRSTTRPRKVSDVVTPASRQMSPVLSRASCGYSDEVLRRVREPQRVGVAAGGDRRRHRRVGNAGGRHGDAHPGAADGDRDRRGAVQGVWLQRGHRERQPGGRVARRRVAGRGEGADGRTRRAARWHWRTSASTWRGVAVEAAQEARVAGDVEGETK